MKRNMDLIRTLLLEIEEQDQGHNEDIEIEIDDHEPAVVEGHLRLLKEAGLIEADAIPDDEVDFEYYKPTRLTWIGHEYLDLVRDSEIWNKTKAGAQKAGGFSLDLLGAIAKGLVKKKIEEHTGVEIDL